MRNSDRQWLHFLNEEWRLMPKSWCHDLLVCKLPSLNYKRQIGHWTEAMMTACCEPNHADEFYNVINFFWFCHTFVVVPYTFEHFNNLIDAQNSEPTWNMNRLTSSRMTNHLSANVPWYVVLLLAYLPLSQAITKLTTVIMILAMLLMLVLHDLRNLSLCSHIQNN